MSRPLNPNAISFTPYSSSSLHSHYHLIPIATDHFPPSPLPLDLLFLPHYPPHHLQPTFYHHYPNPNQQIFYGSPPPPPLIDYRGINNGGHCLKTTSAKPTAPPLPPHCRQIFHSSTSKKHWRRKSVVDGGGASASAAIQISKTEKNQLAKPPSSSDILESIQQGGIKTSVMIKNIPNRYCREMLIQLLVDHCKKQNIKEIKSEASKQQNGKQMKTEASEQKEEDLKEKDFSSAFDFVYLPIDFKTGSNKGYAFVNFTNPNGVWQLYNFLNNYKWGIYNSKNKICKVTYARIQGKDALIQYFNTSTFACEKDEYLPVYLKPYLDGSAQDEAVERVTVGTRLQPSSSKHLSILRRGYHNQQLKRNHQDNGKDGEDEH